MSTRASGRGRDRLRRRPRSKRRVGIGVLASLVIGTLLAVVPASPASAIQTIGWTTPPAATGTLGGTTSFAWTGTANTFLGARITGCFANFPDGTRYSNPFGANFTSGNCQYTNKALNIVGGYQIVVGFTLSSGGTMSLSWTVQVAAPSPTLVNVPSQLTLSADTLNGASMPTLSVYGTDNLYGTYSAACTPASGTVVGAGTSTGTCTATNPAGKSATASFPIVVNRSDPSVIWNLPASVNHGVTYGELQTAFVSYPTGLPGSWVYEDVTGGTADPSAVLPVGANQTLSATFLPASGYAWNTKQVTATITVAQTAQTVAFATGTPTNKTYGDPAFTVRANGTAGGGTVTISAQAGSTCTVGATSGTTSGSATVDITGAGPCVLLADQAASGAYTAAPQATWSVTVAKRTSTITWTTPSPLTYGQSLVSALTASGSTAGTIVYRDSSTGAILDGSTVLDAGSYPVQATFTPSDPASNTSASLLRTISVDKATPNLAIAPIAGTTYGSAAVPASPTSNSTGTYTWTSLTSSVCAVSAGGFVTSLDSGTCTIQVTQSATDNFDQRSAEVSFAVARATIGLDWATPAAIAYGTPLGAAQLNAMLDTSSAPLGGAPMGEMTYTVGSGLPADGHVLDAGDRTITATWTPFGSWATRYDSISTEVTIHVDKAAPAITFPWPSDITYGTALGADQLDATVDGASGTFAYTVDGGEDPAAGQVLDAGTHTITAAFTPDVLSEGNYLPASQDATIVVTPAPQAITFNPGGQHTYGDDPFPVTATGGASGSPVTFTAEAGSSCAVEDGTVTITGAGSCVLVASQAGNANFLPAPAVTRSLTIDRATPKLTWAYPAAITYGAPLGAAQLRAQLAPAGATGEVHYRLADGSPADGAVLHAGDGQVLVATYVPDADGSANFVPVSTSVTIDVAQAPQAIELDPLPLKTFGDADFTIAATGGGSGLPVTFTATGDACTVSGTTVHVVAAGTCQISADQAGDPDHLAATTQVRELVVARAPQTLTLAAIGGHTFGDGPFDVAMNPGPATVPAFASATGDCTILGTTVTITGAGDCTVTAAQGGDTNYLPAPTVTRTFGIAKAGQAITFAELGTANFADGSVEAQASGGSSGNPVTFTAAGNACDVVGTTVWIQHAGTCDVTARQAGARNYSAADAVTRTLTVTPQQLSLGWTPAGLTYGEPVGAGQRNATVTPAVPGTWSYSVDAGIILTAGSHTITATFTPEATGDILPVSADAPVVVDKASQTITFGPVTDRTFGDAPFTVSATGGASGQPVTFSSHAEGCTATPAGQVDITAAGGCTIAADQAGDANFNAAPTVSRSFGVDKAAPTIAWSTPDAITYGTPLGADQLTATAEFQGRAVAGTFTYLPAVGDVLHASTTPQQLTVTFVPTNERDFVGATGATTVVVDRAPQSIAMGTISGRTYGDPPFGVGATGGASGQPVTFRASGACTVADGTVTLVGAGGCTLTADQAGTTDYLAAPSASTSFNVAKQTGSVGLAPIADHTYGDAPFTASTTAGPSSGAITLSATGGCAVGPTGQVSIVAAGTCSVTATQVGDQNTTDASATQTFNVAKAAQTLTFGAVADTSYGAPAFQLAATPGASGTSVTFAVTGTACTVAGSTVTVLAAGTCTITADQAGSANYQAAPSVSRTLTVEPATLTVTAQSASRAFGQANPTFTYAVTGFVNGDTASAITTPPVCSTTATATSPVGRYAITCAGAVTANYAFGYHEGTLTVSKAVTSLTITSPAIVQAGTATVTATLTDARSGTPITGETVRLTADLTVTSATTDPASATFSLKSGRHVVGAVYLGSQNYWPAADSQLLTSYLPTQFVIWGGNKDGVQVGRDYTFFGSQWSKQVTGGSYGGGPSFKGYAGTLTGSTWSTPPGSASNPPAVIGEVISVLVSTSITKSGSTISGNVTRTVLLLVDDADGYRANGNGPEHGTLLTSL